MPTYPGFHPNFDHFKYPPAIRNALRRVADAFYVTRSFDNVNVGNSTYYAALARPTDEMSILLNTDREILFVFSPYDTFEVRTLEAYDEFYSYGESKRIDKSVRYLVSADERITESISLYLSQNPEYPIIIPLTFSSLDKTQNPIVRAIQKNYLIRDLFGYQAPLRQEHFFFGRDATVNAVLDLSKSAQNSSIFGLRKSGKTSTIYAIQRKAKSSDLSVVAIDCQNPAIHARRYDALLHLVVNEVRKVVGGKQVPFVSGKSLPEVSEEFFKNMDQTLGFAKSNVLIIFDEIENISPGTAASRHWRDESDPVYFWQILRSYYQSQTKSRLSFCLVGTSPKLLEIAKIGGVDNPVYLFSQKRFVPNLTFDETRLMIDRLGYFMGLEFPSAVVAKIHEAYGGHPFFTRQVCSKIHQLLSVHRPIQVSMRCLEDAQEAFSGQLESYLQDILNNLEQLYPEELDLLAGFVSGGRGELDEILREAPDLVDHLIGYGFIARRGGTYELTFSAIASVLRRMFPPADEVSLQLWGKIADRRGKIEQGIRRAMFYWSRSVTSPDWSAILNSALSKKRLDALSTIEPSLLFSDRKSPLYLSDLGNLMKDARVLPYIGSRRSSIVEAIFGLNDLRLDAHAKTPTAEDMAKFSLCCEELEGEFLLE